MPLLQCQRDGKRGWKFGQSGHCYVGPGAKRRAIKQGLAIEPEYFTANRQVLSPLKLDPSRTTTLRRRFAAEFAKRYRRLRGAVRRLVVEENAFGLNRPLVTMALAANRITAAGRWAFETRPEQVAQFESWMQTQIDSTIATTAPGQSFWDRYVEQAYRKGQGRAFDDVVRRGGTWAGRGGEFYAGTRAEFLRSAFSRPVAIEKVKLLAGRVLTDLKTVNQRVIGDLSRRLTDGFAQGLNPRDIARRLNRSIDSIGRVNAERIARTEIIHAHAEGQLDAMEDLGVTEVGVMVEWSAAGDDRTCELCSDLDGLVLKVEEARGLIPRHPSCRCCYTPANVGESTAGQKRTKAEIQEAIDSSLRRELPRGRQIKGVGRRYLDPNTGRYTARTGRTLAQQRAQSRWPGADMKIKARRPVAKPRQGSLEDFLARTQKKGSLPPQNVAVVEPDFTRFIVSKESIITTAGGNPQPGIVVYDVTAKKPGSGAFGRALEKLKKRGLPIRIDNVQTERFMAGLRRRGFRPYGRNSAVWEPPRGIAAKAKQLANRPVGMRRPIVDCIDLIGNALVIHKRCKVLEVAARRRAIRAKATHKPATAAKQRFAEANEGRLARGVRARALDDNEAMDVIMESGGRQHGVELKTLLDNANNKITMHPSSKARKLAWAAEQNNRSLHTVIIDSRDTFAGGEFASQYSGHRLYYRRGVGAFRLNSMVPVKDYKQLRLLMEMSDQELAAFIEAL